MLLWLKPQRGGPNKAQGKFAASSGDAALGSGTEEYDLALKGQLTLAEIPKSLTALPLRGRR